MRIIFALLLVICLFTPTSLSASEKKLSGSEKKALINDVIAQYPFFDIAIKGNKKFRKAWIKELTRYDQDKPERNDRSLALEAGVSIAMDDVEHYLPKASDDATNKFFAFFIDFMVASTKDEVLCNLWAPDLGESGNREKEAIFDEKYSDEWVPKMLAAISDVYITGSIGEPRVLSRESSDKARSDMAKRLMEAHGIDVLQRLKEMQDPTTPASRRCETLSWFFKAIDELPTSEKAMLVRTILSN